MADTKELAELRAAGVKRIVYNGTGIQEVEFFEPEKPSSSFGQLDFDTLVPPAAPSVDGDEPKAARVPPALARLLEKGSVS
jgi:hypothetical protein